MLVDLRWYSFGLQILLALLPKPQRLKMPIFKVAEVALKCSNFAPKICSRGIQPSAFMRSNQWQIMSNSKSRSQVAINRP